MAAFNGKILCLCGGVGGAKLAYGFSKILAPEQLTIVVNTADDFEHLGFHISPDIDTVMYNLAEINNQTQGWGIENETWQFMEHLKKNDPQNAWFLLGDKDLLTHQLRKSLLESGISLSEATKKLSASFGISHNIVPMSDDSVQTIVRTNEGDLPFQHYFVKEQCKPAVRGFYFKGIETAGPSKGFMAALEDEALSAVIICPSNPFVSIDPILSLPNIQETILKKKLPVIGVSPIINGQAIKGPTAKMMDELNIPKTSMAIAIHYAQYDAQYGAKFINRWVIDDIDVKESSEMNKMGIHCSVTQTLMDKKEKKIALARFILGCL